jgi:HYR domain
MNAKRIVTVLALLAGCFAGQTAADAATVTRRVTLDTSALANHGAGPFKINFQLTDGDGAAGNSVQIANLSFGQNGSAADPATAERRGGATGDLAAGVQLTDAQLLNDFVQGFTPGSQLSFDLVLTTTAAAADQKPDLFSFAILDSTGAELPSDSQQQFGYDVLLSVSFNAAQLFDAFGSDDEREPAGGGGAINFGAPSLAVPDTTAPVIDAAPAARAITAGNACTAALPDLTGELSASDDVTPADGLVVTQQPAAGAQLAAGVHQVTLTVADAAGNTATASVAITVEDKQAPAVAAKLAQVGSLGSRSGDFRAEFSATDACGAATETAAVMEAPGAAGALQVVFERNGSDSVEIKFDFGRGRVVVAGADAAAAQSLLAQIRAEGGARVSQGQTLRLHSTEHEGKANEQQQFTYSFRGGSLVSVKGPVVRLKVKATDAAGNTATATATPSFKK